MKQGQGAAFCCANTVEEKYSKNSEISLSSNNIPEPTSLKGLRNGWGADLSIHDRVITLTKKGESKVEEFMQKFQAQHTMPKLPTWETKNRLNPEQLNEIDAFIEELKKAGGKDGNPYIANVTTSNGQEVLGIRDYPGGSTGNTMYNFGKTLKNLGFGNFKFNLLTVIGKDKEGENSASIIRKEYNDAGIVPIEPEWTKNIPEAHGRSVIFVRSDGLKISLTNSGLAPTYLNESAVNEDDIKKSDFVFLQSSVRERFGEGFYNKVLNLRWRHNKPLVLALPTSAYAGRHTDNDATRFALPGADYIVCNVEELINIFHKEIKAKFCTGYPGNVSEAEADKIIDTQYSAGGKDREEMEKFAINSLIGHLKDGMIGTWRDNPDKKKIYPVAFITRGAAGCSVVDMSAIVKDGQIDKAAKIKASEIFPALNIHEDNVKSTSGAGDASYAGFLVGRWLGVALDECAKQGMLFAGHKRMGGGPRISDSALSDLKGHIATIFNIAVTNLLKESQSLSKEPVPTPPT